MTERKYDTDDLGGEEDFSEYERPDEVKGSDKLDHFLRSVFHQPNHIKHVRSIPAIPDRIPEQMKKHINRDGRR